MSLRLRLTADWAVLLPRPPPCITLQGTVGHFPHAVLLLILFSLLSHSFPIYPPAASDYSRFIPSRPLPLRPLQRVQHSSCAHTLRSTPLHPVLTYPNNGLPNCDPFSQDPDLWEHRLFTPAVSGKDGPHPALQHSSRLPSSSAAASLSTPSALGCAPHPTPSVSESRVQPTGGIFHSENKVSIKFFSGQWSNF